MNLQETLALLEALRASGVSRFKSLEHDIEFNGKPIAPAPIIQPSPVSGNIDPVKAASEADAKEKLQKMIETLNMTPEQMAKHMFPEDI